MWVNQYMLAESRDMGRIVFQITRYYVDMEFVYFSSANND